jgi:hypothetical protein
MGDNMGPKGKPKMRVLTEEEGRMVVGKGDGEGQNHVIEEDQSEKKGGENAGKQLEK